MIIDIVVVAVALCIGAALLWKKANHIHPVKSHNKIVQFIWNQLGLIMAFLIFFVIGLVLILKNDKLDAKTKKIAIAAPTLFPSWTPAASLSTTPTSSPRPWRRWAYCSLNLRTTPS